MKRLWESTQLVDWQAALESYTSVVKAQDVNKLPERDHWYQHELPRIISDRHPMHISLDDLIKVTEWKMARGVWRARNLMLVRGNDANEVVTVSTGACNAIPHPTSPVSILSRLAGVGPATASAVVAAIAPQQYPFFDEIVAAQIPQAGKLVFNLKYYAWYAEQLRNRAAELGGTWTAVNVEQALWANAGGKAGVRKL